MTEQTMDRWSDEELDSFVRVELGRLAEACPAPALAALPRARRWPLPLTWPADPGRPRRLAPLAAALMVAVALGGGSAWLAAHRLHGQQPAAHPTPHPQPSVAPTPPPSAPPATPSPGANLQSTVPAGVSVFYWATWRSDTYVAHAVDWSGRHRGDITLPSAQGSKGPTQPTMQQSPDGTRLLIDGSMYSEDGQWLGRLPAAGDPSFQVSALWSDDSRHLCVVDNSASTPALKIVNADGSTSDAIALGTTRSSQYLHVRVEWCSTSSGGAILSEFDDRNGSTVRVSLSRHTVTTIDGVPLQSHDGRYVVSGGGAGYLVVRDNATGLSRRVAVGGAAIGFSWDGADLLADIGAPSTSGGIPDRVPGMRLVEWRTGRVLWQQANAQTEEGFWLADPAGGRMAIGFADYRPNTGVWPSGPLHLDLVTAATARRQRIADDFTDMFGLRTF
jgi:hypothetical protein